MNKIYKCNAAGLSAIYIYIRHYKSRETIMNMRDSYSIYLEYKYIHLEFNEKKMNLAFNVKIALNLASQIGMEILCIHFPFLQNVDLFHSG